VPLWYKKIKSGRKTANIIIQKNLRSFITVKAHCSMTHLNQQKITWFLLVLHWAMDVIYDFCYIHGGTAQWSTRINQVIFAVLDVSLNNF